MRFWKRWIADFRGKTKGCSLAELGAYDVLLDEYYAHERALPSEPKALYRIAGAIDQNEREAVDSIISRFFVKGEDGLMHNKKADEYLEDERRYSAEQRERGKLGVQARRKSNGGWWKSTEATLEEGKKWSLTPRPGEEWGAFRSRIFEAINAHRDKQQ